MERSYEIGGKFFGIRTNSDRCAAWLADVLAEYEVTDEEADPYYSVWLAEGTRVGRAFNVLYREEVPLTKTFDLEALGRTLISELDSYTLQERDDAVHLEAMVVASNGVTALVPSPIVPHVRALGTKVDRELSVRPETTVAVDASSGRIVPSRTALRLPENALARFAAIGREGELRTPSIRRSIDVFCTYVFPADEPIEPISRGQAVYSLASMTKNLDQLGQAALEGLSSLVEQARCYRLRDSSAREALGSLKQVLAEP